MGVSLLLGLTLEKHQTFAKKSAEKSDFFGPRFRQKWHFQPKRPSKSKSSTPTMSIFIDQTPICSNGDPFRKKSVPKTWIFIKFLSAEKIIEKAVGQNVKNWPPVAPKQFLDPSYRTAASFRLTFTPPNIQKTSPESSFDHLDLRYTTQLFPIKQKKFKMLLPLVNLRATFSPQPPSAKVHPFCLFYDHG